MTIEEYIIDYLAERLSVGVSGSVPHPMPAEFITVEKTGSSLADRIHGATIAVQSWSTSRASAAALCELVTRAMLASVAEGSISECRLTASYNNPDLETHKPRYSASFEVTHYL